MTAIALSRVHFPVTTLGPGRRIGVWLQGCSIRCPGCISMDTWTHGRGMTTVETVMQALGAWLSQADGLTVSGGEPFEQPIALRELLRAVRDESNVDVLVYSGYPIERIARDVAAMDGLIDALITDPFDLAETQLLPLRGSDNQRLHLLTPLGHARLAQFDIPDQDRVSRFDLMVDEDGTAWLAGIPGREDVSRLQGTLAALGHEVILSADRRRRRHDGT